jgi:hypothetical protein
MFHKHVDPKDLIPVEKLPEGMPDEFRVFDTDKAGPELEAEDIDFGGMNGVCCK